MSDDTPDLSEMDSDNDYEAQYEARNEHLRNVIDILAGYDATELVQYGAKTQIADAHDIEDHRVHYVLNHWDGLVKWRRAANLDPLSPDVVESAYDDPVMTALAGGTVDEDDKPDEDTQLVADGASSVTVNLEFNLAEVFRAVKLLPSDLGLKMYAQTLEADLPRAEIQQILQAAQE